MIPIISKMSAIGLVAISTAALIVKADKPKTTPKPTPAPLILREPGLPEGYTVNASEPIECKQEIEEKHAIPLVLLRRASDGAGMAIDVCRLAETMAIVQQPR